MSRSMTDEEIRKELLMGRQEIEGNFVFALWKDPLAFGDYIRAIDIKEDLVLDEGKYYFTLGKALYLEGYTTFDEATVLLFLSDKPKLTTIYEKYGGYDTISQLMAIVNEKDIDVHYDKLMKNNILLRLNDIGFNIEDKIDKFKLMTSDQIYDYYEFLLNNIMVNKISKINTTDIAVGYEEFLKDWDSGVGVGFPIGFPLLNYHLAGIHRKNLILHLAGIGKGKTSTTIPLYILPTLESGEKVCIIANEQDEEEWRQMILSTVLTTRIGYFGMNRQKFLFGGFTEEDKKHLKKAVEWLSKYEDMLQFAFLQDYDTTNVERIIKRHSKLGTGIFIFDTLKPEDDSSAKSWGEFSELAKGLFETAKQEDVAIVATAQLSPNANSRKFLDLSCIGKSRAIAETAGQVVMFRPVSNKEKETLEVYRYVKDNSGKYQKSTESTKLHADRDYIVLFVPKNRYGRAGDLQIVYERNMSFNTMKEIGYCDIEYDGFE